MVLDALVEQGADHVLDLAHTGIAKLQHLAAIQTDEVVMLPESITFLIDRLPRAKLMALDEVAFDEQVQGIVDRGAAHAVILVFHVEVERLHIKMVGATVDFLQYRKPLGRLALPALVEIGRKDPLDLLSAYFCPVRSRKRHLVLLLGEDT